MGSQGDGVVQANSDLWTRGVVATARGGAEVVAVQPVRIDEPAVDEVRVKVEAAGISHADLLMMQGVHPERRRPPFVPGWDVVGVVDRVGSGVDAFRVGDRVAALTISGGWAELAVAPAARTVVVPDGLDPAEAVCAVMDGVVAYQMLTRTAAVNPGDVVLVQGGGGGVGTALLHMASALGVQVLATDRASKREALEARGATAIDFEREDVVERCRNLTNDQGVNAVFDGVGRTMADSYAALDPTGTVVLYGLTGFLRAGRRNLRGILATTTAGAAVLLRSLLPGNRRRVQIYSIQKLAQAHPDWYRADLAAVLAMLADGRLEPFRPKTVTAEQISGAMADLAAGTATGKQVLVSDLVEADTC